MASIQDIETFDYDRQLIHYNGNAFPFVVVVDEKSGIGHIISTVALEKQLMNDNGDVYVSNDAQWIDEQITFFVETAKELNCPAKDILAEIYD